MKVYTLIDDTSALSRPTIYTNKVGKFLATFERIN